VALFSFTLTIEGADILTDDAINALYEAGLRRRDLRRV
jgi:hypothetical protein